MLTVKHISLGGTESIQPAKFVEFLPAISKQCAPASDTLMVYRSDGTSLELHGGTVFVMNEAGKTVSRYDLGASEVGFNDDPLMTAHAIKERSQKWPLGVPRPDGGVEAKSFA